MTTPRRQPHQMLKSDHPEGSIASYDLYHKTTTLPDISKIMRQMALSYSSDKNFKAGFEPSAEDEDNFYYWSGIRYFLYEYEEHLAKGRDSKMAWEYLEKSDPQKTIEHVLPQKPQDKYWRDRFDRDARNIFTHSVGNLTLTFDNSVYGNKAYPDKCGDLKSEKPCYATSSLFQERKIAKDFDDWNEQAIRKRAKEIRNWALERWQIESADLPKEEIELITPDETEADDE
ncbi:MAG: HNH endonuclease family protein [Verrucomicrobiota bacterium]